MWYVVCAVAGILVGIVLSFILWPRKSNDPPVGEIVFDRAISEDVPYLALGQASDLDKMRRKKQVTLNVIRFDSSQK